MTSVSQQIENMGMMLLERFIDPPTDVVLGTKAYHELQDEFMSKHRLYYPITPNNQPPHMLAFYTSFGQINIRVDRSVKPDHISLGKYTPEQAALISTLGKLDLLGDEFYSLQ